MLIQRKWQILSAISSGKAISEIEPPLAGTEIRFFIENKAGYDAIKSKMKPGESLVFVPPDDMDYDESDEPWPPVYDEKKLVISENQDTISEKTQYDGAPFGNQNAAGPHKRSHLSKADKEKYEKRIVGQITSDGVKVTGFSDHAFDRIAQRNLSPKRIETMLASNDISPDRTHPNRRCYDTDGSRLVLDFTDGTIVTVEWRR